MPKQVTITPEVREVLSRATVAGPTERPTLKLNQPGLERGLYVNVDKVLKALGGKWDRGAGGHTFNRPFEGELADALRSGVAVDQARTNEQFFTPPEVARAVWARSGLIGGEHVLEPSAGAGALLAEPIRYACRITAVERDEQLADELAELVFPAGGEVFMADFMEWTPPGPDPIDAVLMNPPFSRGQAMDHVLRALSFLAPGGVLVAVMSTHWTFAESRKVTEFKAAIGEHSYVWNALPAGSFKASGTGVNSGLLSIHKGY